VDINSNAIYNPNSNSNPHPNPYLNSKDLQVKRADHREQERALMEEGFEKEIAEARENDNTDRIEQTIQKCKRERKSEQIKSKHIAAKEEKMLFVGM
jgi:hypothetical protein